MRVDRFQDPQSQNATPRLLTLPSPVSPIALLLFSIVVSVVSGCVVSDDDRCPGLVWDAEVSACYAPDTDTETTSDSGADAGDTPSGFGTPCFSNDACTSEVDFCQLNILTPDEPGICTVVDCVPMDCPETYQCCDCSKLGQNITCIPDEGAVQAAAFGCTCE